MSVQKNHMEASEDADPEPHHCDPDDFLRYQINRFHLSRRIVMSLYLLFGCVMIFSLQSNVSMAIVDMTAVKIYTFENGSTVNVTAVDWDSKNCALILGSFYVGSLVASTVVSRITSAFGGPTVIAIASTIAGASSMLTPVIFEYVVAFAAIRMLQGAAEMLILASLSQIWPHWFPHSHRSAVVFFMFVGTYLGSAFSYATSGYVAMYWHWSWIFYATGSVVVLWGALSLLIVHKHPPNSSYIVGSELVLEYASEKPDTKKPIPFSGCVKLLTSKLVIVSVAFHFALGFGTIFIRNLIPFYVSDFLHSDICKVGIISSVPLVPALILYSLLRLVEYFLEEHECCTVRTRRHTAKIIAFIGLLCTSFIFGLAGFAKHLTSVTECLLLLAVFHSLVLPVMFSYSGEMGTEHEGTVIAVNVFAYTVSQLVGSSSVGFLVILRDALEWRIVFGSFAAIQLCLSLIFAIFHL